MTTKKRIHQLTIPQFEAAFPDEDACCAYLVKNRWPEAVSCPRCGNENVYELQTMKWKWECSACREGGAYRYLQISVGRLSETKVS